MELGTVGQDFAQLRIPLRFPEGPPNFEPRDDIRITDRAAIIRTAGETEAGGELAADLVQRRWSWPGPGGKPVYNFRSEGREFNRGRCLIIADGFYEFTDPQPGSDGKKPKRKDKWLFTKVDEPWFCIAGIWRASEAGEAFTMLTTEPCPDVAPYHHRQIAVLDRRGWAAWLDPRIPAREVLKPLPAGSLHVEKVSA